MHACYQSIRTQQSPNQSNTHTPTPAQRTTEVAQSSTPHSTIWLSTTGDYNTPRVITASYLSPVLIANQFKWSRHRSLKSALNRGCDPGTELNFSVLSETLAFTPQRFHVLIYSLFKVLFNFPSRYLFAIGLATVFSFRRALPPTLSCIPKQLDSSLTLWFVSRDIWASHLLRARTLSKVLSLVQLTHRAKFMSQYAQLQKQRVLTLSSSLFIRHY